MAYLCRLVTPPNGIVLDPSSCADIPVEPEPIKGSNTIPFGGVTNLHKYAISWTGLTVGWLFLYNLGAKSLGNNVVDYKYKSNYLPVDMTWR